MLPPKIPKARKQASRWRSQAHETFVKAHACASCGSLDLIQGAHVRKGSHTGIAQKPDDWRMVSLCKPCHDKQHNDGEVTFWRRLGKDPKALIRAFIAASPRRHQIEQTMRERGL